MVPKRGPSLFSVPGFDAGAAGPVAFRWPRALFCTGFSLVPRDGDPGTLADARIQIVDEEQDQIIFDGVGGVVAPGLALSGSVWLASSFSPLTVIKPFVLQRPVMDGDTWKFTLSFSGEGGGMELLLYFDEGLKP